MLLSKKNGIKLKKILFKLLILLLPIQLSKHFWPSWAYLSGIRVDYLAPAVYLTDILLSFLLSVWLVEMILKKASLAVYFKNRKTLLILTALVLFSYLNIAAATNPYASLFKWVKILEIFAFTLFVIKEREVITKESLFYPLSIAIFYTTVIGVAQFVMQRTIGGPFYFLGERTFSSSTPGIALGDYFGRPLLRPYATFPHPNALAGFLAVSFFMLIGQKTINFLQRVVKILVIACTLLLLLLSNSQGAWVVFLVCYFLYFFSKYKFSFAKNGVFLLVISTIGLSIISPVFFQKLLSQMDNLPQSLERRISLAVVSGQMIAEKPALGVGLNNFLVVLRERGAPFDLSWLMQPVHNIFLLVFVEAGLLGLILFVYVLAKALRNLYRRKKGATRLMPCLLAIVLTGIFDHYWLTLQQTQLLFSLVLGLSLRIDD